MFLSCRRSPLLLSSTILRRTHLWLPYPQHMLFFLYWSVSLFCILNLRPHQTQLASSIAALRAARWRACVCVVGRVVRYKDEVLRHKLDHISFNRPLLFISKESFNYDLFIRPVFVFCLSRRHRDTHVRACIHTHTHTFSLRVLIARLSARKPSVWRCCGRQRKQRCGYSNEHPIMPAKSHFCVAHTGAKLHSFDLKPLLTQLRRWVISPRRLTGVWDNTSSGFCLLFLFLYLSWAFSQYLAFIKGVERDKRGRLQITDNDAGLMKRMEKFH